MQPQRLSQGNIYTAHRKYFPAAFLERRGTRGAKRNEPQQRATLPAAAAAPASAPGPLLDPLATRLRERRFYAAHFVQPLARNADAAGPRQPPGAPGLAPALRELLLSRAAPLAPLAATGGALR